MNNNCRIFSITLLLLLNIASISAQDKDTLEHITVYRHEISLLGGGGLSSLQYSPTAGKTETNLGGQFGVGYNFFFSPNWSINTGLEMSLYTGKFTAATLDESYPISKPAGAPKNSSFYFQSAYQNYEETQTASYLNIPLMIQYQTLGKHKFYASAGVKIGIPLSASYESTAESLTTRGYSDYTEQYYENMPPHGFDTYQGVSSSGDLDMNLAFLGAMETGMKWQLSNQISLYTGLYVDYGFNNIKSTDTNTNMVVYDEKNPTKKSYNSLFQSEFVDKVSPMGVGIKLKLSLGAGKKIFDQIKYPKVDTVNIVDKAEIDRLAIEKMRNAQTAQSTEANQKAREMIDRLQTEQDAIYKSNLVKITAPIYGSDFDSEQKSQLDEKIVILRQYPNMNITINVSACEEDTLREPQERAEKIKKYLVANDISSNRIKTKTNETPNCRTELRVDGK